MNAACLPFYFAVELYLSDESDTLPIISALLAAEANPDLFEKDCCTTFITEIESDKISLVKVLLEGGVNPNIAGDDGCSPLAVAMKYKKMHLVTFLKTYGAK